MSDQATTDTADEALAIDGRPTPGRRRRKPILVLCLLALLLGGGTAVAGFLGLGAGVPFSAELRGLMGGASQSADDGAAVFYDLPELLVNLKSAGATTGYLKIVVALELDDAGDRREIDELLPRVIDNFQVYLRELRVEDLQGSAGLQRLREELLGRVNAALPSVRVRDVLFKEILVQ